MQSAGERKVLYPLDFCLGILKGKYSYLLQDWIGNGASESDFRQVCSWLNRIFDYGLVASEVQRISASLSSGVESYYSTDYAIARELDEGEILVLQGDNKGVPLCPKETGREVEAPVARMGKGKKKGIKKLAMVTATYSVNLHTRTTEEVLENLIWKNTRKGVNPTSKEKSSMFVHKRAFLEDPRQGIPYAVEDLKKRDSYAEKRIVALIDGGPGLEDEVIKCLDDAGLANRLDAIILDIIHVSEYVWVAANAIVGEKHKNRTQWVADKLGMILNGETEKLISEISDEIKKDSIKEAQLKSIQKVITYFTNHKHKMDYPTYMSKGYPISTAIVEGACGHLVKDRMEQSGMKWTIKGAQNILNLRSILVNNEWDNFSRVNFEAHRNAA